MTLLTLTLVTFSELTMLFNPNQIQVQTNKIDVKFAQI